MTKAQYLLETLNQLEGFKDMFTGLIGKIRGKTKEEKIQYYKDEYLKAKREVNSASNDREKEYYQKEMDNWAILLGYEEATAKGDTKKMEYYQKLLNDKNLGSKNVLATLWKFRPFTL
jgi:hypothetical protein